MRFLIRRYPVASYFTLAFAISWGGILAVIRGGAIPAPADETQRLFVWVYLVMLAGPSMAGLVLTAVVASPHQYVVRLTKWRVAPIWYALALLTAPFALAVTALALSRFSGDFLPAVFGNGAIEPPIPVRASAIGSFLVVALAVGLGAGFFEELGWTGYATPALLKRISPTSTGIVVGLLWGAWHFLAVLWGSAGAFATVPVRVFMLVALFTFLPPYRVLMVRVYERTGSLLIGILMHASLTTSMIVFGPAIKGWDSVIYNLTFAAVLWAIVATTIAGDKLREARGLGHSAAPRT